MSHLTNPKIIKEIMNKYSKNFKKSLGQNFLIDTFVLDKIVNGSDINEDSEVLEIGAGIGVLTYELANCAKKVVSVEIDTKLIPVLNDTLSEFDNVKIINEDILKIDINKLIEENFKSKKIKIVANLPYYITTPIILKLIEYKDLFESVTVMVQKEVAERMNAKEGGKDFSSLSVIVQYYTRPEIIANVLPTSFMPAPKVSSSVIKLNILDKPSVTPISEEMFFKVVRASFAQRRKTLVNGVSNAGIGYTKQQVQEVLQIMGVSQSIRGEALSLSQFALLSDELVKMVEKV